MPRLLSLLVVCLVLAVSTFTASPVLAKSILFITAQPTQPGKYERIIPLARERGHEMTYLYIDKMGEATAADLSRHDFVVIDAAYGAALGAARARLTAMLREVTAPWIWVLNDGGEHGNIAPDDAELLQTYMREGGRANFRSLMCSIDQKVFGDTSADCPAPQMFPDAGIYHPAFAGRVFNELSDYLAFKQVDPAGKAPPAVGILFHEAHLAADLTTFLDDLIGRLEARGILPVAMYLPAARDGDITRLVTAHDRRWVDLLINSQIVLNPEGRKKEFNDLGVPVIQAMPYRKGDQAVWEADTAGITLTDIPFYLAQPEYAGIVDPIVAAVTRKSDGDIVPLDDQLASVVDKAAGLIALRHTPQAEKKAALLFWNYPPGQKNLGASFLNLPRSIESTMAAMKAHGWTVDTPDETALTERLTALLSAHYEDDALNKLIDDGLAETFPLSSYRQWFNRLPENVRIPIMQRFGDPANSGQVVERDGVKQFIMPRYKAGNLILMAQPPRGEKSDDRERALYHDTKVPPSHAYLATYLWVREEFGANAIIHYGTHGTAEWQPGKERGLSVHEAPYLVLGGTPVLYPYIVDNVGEAMQAKRRGRATIITHNTPSFSPAGLHGEINQLHDLLHSWLTTDDGEVKGKTFADLVNKAIELNIDKDMRLDRAGIEADPARFGDLLHIHIHDLALQQQPLGLATFGRAAEDDLRLFTVMQMLGRPLLDKMNPEDPEELLAIDYEKLRESPVFTTLDRHIRKGEPVEGDAVLAELIERGRGYWASLTDNQENVGLLAGLDGRHVQTSYGGDPIKNPDSLPTGRNLYGFDPTRVPTKQAWEAGFDAAQKLINQHREANNGEWPTKFAFTMWSVETMRQFGMLEAQALAVMGYRPVWDRGGRVTGIEQISREELGRPRVDAVISATGLYRDHFPQAMKLMAEAAKQASELDEPDNAIAENTRKAEAALRAEGINEAEAKRWALTRIFSSESGAYSTGLDDAALATDTWGQGADGKEDRKAGDAKLANLYLNRMQFAYGPDESTWGEKPPVNAYAEHLKGIDGALLSRSSNLYGMLTTDDPFQYLGGIGLAVRHLTGKTPELYISNLRESGRVKVETASGFLAKEVRGRYTHPGWIKEMQKEGYSGTLEILSTVNNLWGWEATAPETVRDDQWQSFKEVYVDDSLDLGVKEWFEKNNPHAQAQIIERMLEAVRKEYWAADDKTVADLVQRYQELADRYAVTTDNEKFKEFVTQTAAGFGLSAPAATEPPQAEPQQPPATPNQIVEGQRLEKQESAAEQAPTPWEPLLALGLLLLSVGAGAVRQARLTGGAMPLTGRAV